MLYAGIFLAVVLILIAGYSCISKIIIEELNRCYNTYKKKDTLYYKELQDLVNRISIEPAFLKEAAKLILKIEEEEEGKNMNLC